MRKIGALVLIAALIFVAGFAKNAMAASAGNCLEPLQKTTEHLGVAGGFQYNYVQSRYNKLNNEDSRIKDMDVKNLNEYYGKIGFGVFNNFNIYGTVGGANYDVQYVDRVDGALIDIDLGPGLYTGAGINCLFPLFDKFGIGSDLHAGFFLNNIDKLRRDGADISGASGQLYGIDGVNSVYINYRYDIESFKTALIPYVGGYYSWLLVGTAKKINYTAGGGISIDQHLQPAFDVMAFGVIAGIDIEITKYAVLNVEGRFLGENALSAGASVKF